MTQTSHSVTLTAADIEALHVTFVRHTAMLEQIQPESGNAQPDAESAERLKTCKRLTAMFAQGDGVAATVQIQHADVALIVNVLLARITKLAADLGHASMNRGEGVSVDSIADGLDRAERLHEMFASLEEAQPA